MEGFNQMAIYSTNHLERPKEKGKFFEVESGIFNNNYVKMLPKESPVIRLLTNAYNNGVFFRVTDNLKSKNYFQPLSNAGIPAMKKSSMLHETSFFIHDVLHHNYKDLQISKVDDFHKNIYIMYRIIGESIALFFADWHMLSEIESELSESEIETVINKKIYPAYKGLKDYDMYKNIRNHAKYAVFGEKAQFIVDNQLDCDLNTYMDWFEPVYAKDILWTLRNADNILEDFSTDWVNYMESKPKNFYTTDQFLEDSGLCITDNADIVFNKIVDYYIGMVSDIIEHPVDKESQKNTQTNAKKQYIAFQQKAYFSLEKSELGETFFKLGNILLDSDYIPDKNFAEYEKVYQEYIEEMLLVESDKTAMKNLKSFPEVYSEVYVHFPFFTVSYDSKDLEVPLKEFAEDVFESLYPKKYIYHKKLIQSLGGKTLGNMVLKPAVNLIGKTEAINTQPLINSLDVNSDPNKSLLDINAKLSYLNFKPTPKDFAEKILIDRKHYNIGGNIHYSFIVAGVSLATLLEFTSSTAQISRVTTSATNAMNKTLYVGNTKDILAIESFVNLRNAVVDCENSIEKNNSYNLETKAVTFTVDYSIGDWLWYIEKIKTSNEIEFIQVLKEIERQLLLELA